MSCACHKTSRNAVDAKKQAKPAFASTTQPTDQCAACAQKHLDQAVSAYFEYSYEAVNRSFIRAQLRAVVNHTYRDWPFIADRARKLALTLQQYRDSRATDDEMRSIQQDMDKVFLKEYPEAAERRQQLIDSKENADGR